MGLLICLFNFTKNDFSQEEQTERACVLFQIVSINVLKTSVKCFRPNLIESHYRILSKVSFLLMYHFCIVKKLV